MKAKNNSLLVKVKKQYSERQQSVKEMYLRKHTVNPADYYIRVAKTERSGKQERRCKE